MKTAKHKIACILLATFAASAAFAAIAASLARKGAIVKA